MSEKDNAADDTSVDTATAGDAEAAPEDPVRNLKSEVSRKFENLNSQFAQLNQSLQALANRNQPEAAPVKQASLKDQMFEDPDGAAEVITQRAVARADQIISAKVERQQALQQTVLNMTAEYPEMGKNGSEAANTAQRIHASLPAHLQNTPEGAELAISRAASQLGLTPTSKRRKQTGDDDGFIPQSKGSPRGRATSAESELTDEQFTFAHILNESIGRKFDEKKLKKYAGRKNWTTYGEGEES